MTLFRHALRRQALSLLLWFLAFAVMAGSVVSVAGTLRHTDLVLAMLNQMPAAMRALLGGDLLLTRPIDGYLHVKIFQYLPLMVGIFAAFQAAAMVARDVEQHRFDFLLGLPVSRPQLLLARFGALLTSVAALWALTIVAIAALLRQQGLSGDLTGYWLTAYNGFLVDLLLAAIALWVSAGASEYRKALRTALVIVAVPFVIDLSLRMAQAAKGWLYLQPYGYYDPPHLMLTHAFPWVPTLALGGAAALVTTLALRTFRQREV